MPTWLAPNMVTLIGFFFIIGNVALLELYIPDLVGPVRSLQIEIIHLRYLLAY